MTALGKGLASLIPEKRRNAEEATASKGESVFIVEIDRIVPNPHQPRREFNEEGLQELASSIREHGVLQPLIVSKVEEEHEGGSRVFYELIAGERRWRAARLAGLPRVPVIVRAPQAKEKLEIALVENLQRSDLSAVEEAEAYRRLMDEFGLTQQAVAERVGRSRSAVANILRLLELPDDIRRAVQRGEVSEGHARALLRLSSPAERWRVFREIVEQGLSVREVERRTGGDGGAPRQTAKRRPQGAADAASEAVADELSTVLGAPVRVVKGPRGGRIVISFYSDEELAAIRGALIDLEAPHGDNAGGLAKTPEGAL